MGQLLKFSGHKCQLIGTLIAVGQIIIDGCKLVEDRQPHGKTMVNL